VILTARLGVTVGPLVGMATVKLPLAARAFSTGHAAIALAFLLAIVYVKAYVPIGDFPPFEWRFGLVLVSGTNADEDVAWSSSHSLRHPRPTTPSVYQRWHQRVHSRYTDR
jgi:hypothetical protein